MTNGTYDAIVVGLGGMGSAAAFELARRGRRVLGLEQFKLGHNLGSSHGQTRIIRRAYYEHPDYVPLVGRAFERWYDLEQRSGEHLLTECGCLTIGPPESDLIQGVLASAQQHNLSVERFTSADIRRRFSPFHFADPNVGVLEQMAGILAVEQCVRTHVNEARKLGADLRDEEPVLSWQVADGGVTVDTPKGKHHGSRLILTTGPWAPRLLGAWGARLTVMRQVMLWFRARGPWLFRRDVFPVYIADTPLGVFYGFPLLDTAQGIKVAQHYGAEEQRTAEEIERHVHAPDEEAIRRFVRAHLPAVDGPLESGSVCIYTLTPDRHFLIDVHPDHPQVSIAAGFSGHGFKFAPVVGEILADLAEHGRTDLPISRFRLDRFRE